MFEKLQISKVLPKDNSAENPDMWRILCLQNMLMAFMVTHIPKLGNPKVSIIDEKFTLKEDDFWKVANLVKKFVWEMGKEASAYKKAKSGRKINFSSHAADPRALKYMVLALMVSISTTIADISLGDTEALGKSVDLARRREDPTDATYDPNSTTDIDDPGEDVIVKETYFAKGTRVANTGSQRYQVSSVTAAAGHDQGRTKDFVDWIKDNSRPWRSVRRYFGI